MVSQWNGIERSLLSMPVYGFYKPLDDGERPRKVKNSALSLKWDPRPVLFIGGFSVLLVAAFILGCYATSLANQDNELIERLSERLHKKEAKNQEALKSITDIVNRNAQAVESLEYKMVTLETAETCTEDVTWGQAPHHWKQGGSWYQVEGGEKASFTWHDARRQASERCFKGHQVKALQLHLCQRSFLNMTSNFVNASFAKGYLATIKNKDEDDFLTDLVLSLTNLK